MERRNKEYLKPLMVMEEFQPQEFVAACTLIKPYDYKGDGVYIDIVTGNMDANYTPGADGLCQGASAERFYNGAPNYIKNNFKDTWIEHTTIYKCTSTSATGSYDSSIFTPLTAKGSVAVYISPRGLHTYVVEGDGSKPNIDIDFDNYDNPVKTFS